MRIRMLVLLAAAASVLAVATPASAATGNPSTGRLVGRMVDAAGHPLRHVLVQVGRPGAGNDNATTGNDGAFSVRLTPGSYSICYYTEDTRGPSRTGYDPRCSGSEVGSRPLVVTAGRTTDLGDQVLRPAAAVVGVVTDALTGEPLADALVSSVGGPQVFLGRADRAGRYAALPLPVGASDLRVCLSVDVVDPTAAPYGYADTCFSAAGLASGRIVARSVALLHDGAVSGRVTNASGQPLDGYFVQVTSGAFARTAPDGSYTVTGVPPGETGVCYSPDGRGEDGCQDVTVDQDRVTSGVDFVDSF